MTESIRVLLHDHLDGGLRPETAFELAMTQGVELPRTVDSPAALDAWFRVTPGMELSEAFSRFDLPISVMRSAQALERIVIEATEDLVSDGVAYAEIRFAPLLHVSEALTADQVLESVVSGIQSSPAPITTRLILCAMRTERRTSEVVDLAKRWATEGVVGVDLAGPEPGEPVEPHATAFASAKDFGLGVTIHAGEMDTFENVQDAITLGHADRIGHGWRLIDDCQVENGQIVGLGSVAELAHRLSIPLEMCLTSNESLGVPVDAHPLLSMLRAGFKVTANTDNRTITRCTLTSEVQRLVSLGCTADEIRTLELNAKAAVFDPTGAESALARGSTKER